MIQSEVEAFLEHHGIKGMRWGVITKDRKANRTARLEKKAQKFDAKAAIFQTKINELNAIKTTQHFERLTIDINKRDYEKQRNQALADAQAKREGHLSSNQKKVVIGASVVAALAVTYGAYKVADSGEFNRMALIGKARLRGEAVHSWKQDARLAQDMDISRLKTVVVDKINPRYGLPGTKMNCRRATFAYEMRRRGFDVRATKSMSGTGQTVGGVLKATTKEDLKIPTTKFNLIRRLRLEGTELSPNAGPGKVRLADLMAKRGINALGTNKIDLNGVNNNHALFNALKSQPDGARGEITLAWRAGGLHSMAWENIKGVPHIIDAQTKKIYSTPLDIFNESFSAVGAGFTRLDNLPLNHGYLQRWLTDA